MKIVRKYTNMAFLLLSIASIVPAYGNKEIINENQNKQEIVVETKKANVVWYKRPEVRQKIETACVIGVFVAAFVGVWYMDAFRLLNRSVSKQQEQQSHNSITGVTVLGTITQTDGKNTTIITPGKKPVWIKQDSAGTWMKKDESSPWVLYRT